MCIIGRIANGRVQIADYINDALCHFASVFFILNSQAVVHHTLDIAAIFWDF